jgi:hypothetical protein
VRPPRRACAEEAPARAAPARGAQPRRVFSWWPADHPRRAGALQRRRRRPGAFLDISGPLVTRGAGVSRCKSRGPLAAHSAVTPAASPGRPPLPSALASHPAHRSAPSAPPYTPQPAATRVSTDWPRAPRANPAAARPWKHRSRPRARRGRRRRPARKPAPPPCAASRARRRRGRPAGPPVWRCLRRSYAARTPPFSRRWTAVGRARAGGAPGRTERRAAARRPPGAPAAGARAADARAQRCPRAPRPRPPHPYSPPRPPPRLCRPPPAGQQHLGHARPAAPRLELPHDGAARHLGVRHRRRAPLLGPL